MLDIILRAVDTKIDQVPALWILYPLSGEAENNQVNKNVCYVKG